MAEERLKSWETLFRIALEILDSARRAGPMACEWSFGGGTVLMRRYRHRVSTDIDIFIPDPQLLGYLSPRLNPSVEALTSDYDEQANFLKLYFPQGEIDFVVSGFLTAEPVVTEHIQGRDIQVETSAEIIAKKVWYRGAEFTARDMFDLVLVAEREPHALRTLREIFGARRSAILARIADWNEALREDFAALDTLDYRPSFEECIAAIRDVIAASAPRPLDRAEQRLALYRVPGRALRLQFGL